MNVIGLLFISLLFFISAFVGAYKGVAKAFIYVFIPVLFLVPGSVYVKLVEGIPRLTPILFVLIPILIMYIVNQAHTTKFNLVDFLIGCYFVSIFTSNLINNGYWDAQHNLFNDIWGLLLPYIFAKNLIHPQGYSFSLGKCMVVLSAFISIVGLIEFFTAKSLFVYIFWRIFPEQVTAAIIGRFGVSRVAGPFYHPIILGAVLGFVICINRWVQAMHSWKPKNFRNFDNIKGIYFTLTIILGQLTTLSRGPLLATCFGYIIAGFYKVNSVKKSLLRLLCVFFAGLLSYKLFEWYTSVSLEEATDLQIPIIYRQQLYDLYYDLIAQKPFFGWGTYMPSVKGFESIDNGFIFGAMLHGIITLSIFLFLFAVVAFRLLFAGLNRKVTFDKKSLAFALLGVFAVYFISICTVALQTDRHCYSLFFTILGWSEGFLAWKYKDSKYVELRH